MGAKLDLAGAVGAFAAILVCNVLQARKSRRGGMPLDRADMALLGIPILAGAVIAAAGVAKAVEPPTPVPMAEESYQRLVKALAPPSMVAVASDALTQSLSGTVDALKRAPLTTRGHLPGYGFSSFLRFGERVPDRDNFVFDADDGAGVRFSVFVEKDGALRMRVLDGTRPPLEARVISDLRTFVPGNVLFVVCEYGSDATASFASISINGSEVATGMQVPPLRTLNEGTARRIIGADVNLSQGGVFDAYDLMVLTGTLSAGSFPEMLKYENALASRGPNLPFFRFAGSESLVAK